MRVITMFFMMLFISLQAFAAGKITGKVSDEKTGDPIIGAMVVIKGTSNGTATDVDGNFLLETAAGTYTLEVRYVGYQSKEVADVKVTGNNTATVNIVIAEAKSTQLQEIVVRSTLKKENISAMITYQKNTNTVAQVVSAEAIRKSPDRNTGEVLKRVSAASIQDGKYLIVRGLADRYNQATLNGTLLSSTEPDRKTFSFDLFPSGMIDNIVVNKAATPDLPGEFAGGLIQVNTKDIPSENFFTIQLGGGVNSQTVGRDFHYYKGGSLDFLGLDDGTRALPSTVPNKDQFRKLTEEQRLAAAKGFKNDWAYDTKSTPINASMQASGGLNTMLFGKKLGAIFAVNYNKQNRRTEMTRSFFNQAGVVQKTLDFNENLYGEDVLVGALANLSMELNANNRISLKNLYNINGSDNVLMREGRDNDYGADVRSYQLGFKSTQYLTTQLIGSHYLPKSKIKLNWNGSYVRLYQNQPNLRRMEYRKADDDSIYRATIQGFQPSLRSASRFYSNLTDNIGLGSFDLSRPFQAFGNQHTIKVGYMTQVKDRVFTSRPFGMVGNPSDLLSVDNANIFAPENVSLTGFNLSELSDKDYDYDANSMLHAGFVMLDNQLGQNFRLVWGARYEYFNQQLNGFRSNQPVNVNTQVGDILPSFNLTYRFNEKTNWRLSASQTVVRPEFRELSPFTFYDFELLAAVQGNPDLERTKIMNVDLRYEFYPRAGEMITAGLFYKKFTNTIEQFFNESGVNTISFTYGNAPDALSYGGEVEFRKKLDAMGNTFKNFTAFANGTYIFNDVRFNIKDAAGNEVKADRPMQGQSPFVINGGLQYDAEKIGTSVTGLFNMVGRRIFLVGNDQNPHIWEAPRPVIDFTISQKVLNKKAEFKFTISDLLNKRANYYQDKNENGKYDVDADFLRISRRAGSNYTLSFLYNFR
ncbi:MAG: TonB-dependent receptor [Sphingobacteriales bacterium]|nr:MAG: TonB-dependent receptor [Sphingobacteriales bacterium]